MSVKTLTLKSEVATLNKVTYNTDTNDMTLSYSDGAVVRYMNVLSSVIDELIDLKKEKLSDDAIINYLTDALSKHYKKSRTFKYNRIVIKKPAEAPTSGDIGGKYGLN